MRFGVQGFAGLAFSFGGLAWGLGFGVQFLFVFCRVWLLSTGLGFLALGVWGLGLGIVRFRVAPQPYTLNPKP